MKACIKCGVNKSLSEYYVHPQMLDGHLGICKECHKSRMTERRRTNPAVQAYDRERYQRPERKAFGAMSAKRWRENNPDKYKAHTAVSNAIRSGKIARPECCSSCGGETKLHAHHDDYSKPLEVRWMCAMCHHREHAEGRK